MSLQFTRREFRLCPTCAAKPGSPILCAECLERRELWYLAERVRDGHIRGTPSYVGALFQFCPDCGDGYPNIECPRHGR